MSTTTPQIYTCKFSTDTALYDTSEDVSEDEMAGWHHPCNGHELGQTLGDGEGHGDWHAAVHGVTKSRTQLGD